MTGWTTVTARWSSRSLVYSTVRAAAATGESPHRRRLYHELAFASTATDPLEVLRYQQLEEDADTGAKQPPARMLEWIKTHANKNNNKNNKKNRTEDALVQIEWACAPWNPADLNTVQGTYGSPYSNPEDQARAAALTSSAYDHGYQVVGSEGWGQVVDIVPEKQGGASTTPSSPKFHRGDWVTVGQSGLGTMRSSVWLPESCLLAIPKAEQVIASQAVAAGVAAAAAGGTEDDQDTVPAAARASTLFQLGGTALRMLSDFTALPPGSMVVQNAGNSGVGFMASQLVALAVPDCYMVSLVRRGDRTPQQYDAMVQYLTTTGKNHMVVAEEDLEDPDSMKEFQSSMKQTLPTSSSRPVLALNAVGGSSSQLLCQLLGPSGTHVTYGGMSRKPVTVGTAQLIFKDLRFFGYWHSRWMIQQQQQQQDGNRRREEMIQQLVDLAIQTEPARRLECPPVKVFPLAKYREALAFDKNQSHDGIRSKIVFACREAAA